MGGGPESSTRRSQDLHSKRFSSVVTRLPEVAEFGRPPAISGTPLLARRIL